MVYIYIENEKQKKLNKQSVSLFFDNVTKTPVKCVNYMQMRRKEEDDDELVHLLTIYTKYFFVLLIVNGGTEEYFYKNEG